jgi:hypothetical protein
LNSTEYTDYFSWQNIGAASATVSFVVQVAAVGEFIFTESYIFSVNIFHRCSMLFHLSPMPKCV